MDHVTKAKGETTSRIAETMNVFTRRVKKLWARYRYTDPDKIVYSAPSLPPPMGRPESNLPGCKEYSAVPAARTEEQFGAMRLHGIIRDSTGINIPYNKIHQILRDENLASEHPKKSRRRKWVRFERVPTRTLCGHRLQVAR